MVVGDDAMAMQRRAWFCVGGCEDCCLAGFSDSSGA
jgi:hypothetical protein